MAGKRKYFDLRYMFIRGLQSQEQMQRGKHYLKSAADCTSKAIVSLELSEKNVNTAKQAVRLDSIGPETLRRLEGYVNSQVYRSDRPAPGRFVSSAGALLVALLNLTELAAADSQGGVVLIPEEQLRHEASKLSEEKFLSPQSPGFCQAWWRLDVLVKRDLVKRRSLHKASVYHLLPLGMDKALGLRDRSLGLDPTAACTARALSPSAPSAPPSPSPSSVSTPAKPRKRKAVKATPSSAKKAVGLTPPKATAVSWTSSSSSSSSSSSTSSRVLPASTPSTSAEHPVEHVLTDAMYSNDKGHDGVVLLVDIQEGGGNRAGLAELCDMIEQTGTVYRTRKLACADYGWLWRCEGVERRLPFWLERKRADDVAFSLRDGRFWGQIDRMTSQKERFEGKGVPVTLQYLVEGQPEKFVVGCADGCQGVGRCGNPSLQQVQRVLCDLRQHPHLEVLAVDSLLDTVRHLTDTTSHLQHRTERGEFDGLVISEMMGASTQSMDNSKTERFLILSDDDDDDDDDAKANSNQDPALAELETQALAEMFKGSHPALPVWEDCDEELPPLGPPPGASRGQRVVNTESGSVGQGAEGTGRGAPPLTTLSGSPRGRVYWMKRKSHTAGSQGSPPKKAAGSEGDDPGPSVTEKGATPTTGKRPHTAGREHHTTGERGRQGGDDPDPSVTERGAPPTTGKRPHTASREHLTTGEGGRQGGDDTGPSVTERGASPTTGKRPHTAGREHLTTGEGGRRGGGEGGRRRGGGATLARPGLSPVPAQTEGHRGAGDSPGLVGPTSAARGSSREGSQLGPPPPPSPESSDCSSNKPAASDNLTSGILGAAGRHATPRVSEVSATPPPRQPHCRPPPDIKEKSPFVTDAFTEDANGSAVSVRSGDDTFFSHKDRDEPAAGKCPTDHLFHPSTSGSHSNPAPYAPHLGSVTSAKGKVVTPGDFPPPSNCRTGEKDTVCARYSGESDSDVSLPDIDLSMGLSGRPSQTISSSAFAPNPPPTPSEDQEGEITLRPWRSNSQEKESGAAPRPPQTADNQVQPADKIAQIAVVFPQMRGSQIAEMLRRFDGDVERSVIGILEDPGLVGVWEGDTTDLHDRY